MPTNSVDTCQVALLPSCGAAGLCSLIGCKEAFDSFTPDKVIQPMAMNQMLAIFIMDKCASFHAYTVVMF
jgi:hypothetical protein